MGNAFYRGEKKLQSIFSDKLSIEHIGSTAIPGIKSKATIDILIEKPLLHNDMIIQTMTTHGYIHMIEQLRHLMS